MNGFLGNLTLLSLPIIYPAHSPNLMLHDFQIFGPIKKTLKGYTVTSDDNMQEAQYSGLGSSPKNSLQSRYADLCASRGFLSKMPMVNFSNCCNTFTCKHPKKCFICICLTLCTLSDTNSTSTGPPWQYKKTSKSCCNEC